VFLTFPEGVNLSVGDVYRIVRPIGLSGDRYSHLGHPRKSVAIVKIVKLTDRTRAQIQVMDGSVLGGVSAERLKGAPL
jgi:hypothetical protein